jgi:replication initiation protein RepC
MQIGNVTTPFGRRPMTLALVKRQVDSAEIKPGKRVDKWRVFRDVCEARAILGVQDRALAVLDALLSFHRDKELSQDGGLIVFPSNMQLSVRAHGIAGTTLRRHLAVLVEAGLIVRKDSANGKRYAHKDRQGGIEEAFGFDLSPLLARADEFAVLAQQVTDDRARVRRAKEALTICRRDVRKLISAAIDEGADGDWEMIESIYIATVARIPRSPTPQQIADLLDEMQMLHAEVVNRLGDQVNSIKADANDLQNGRHIQNSKSESIIDLEPALEKKQGEISERQQFGRTGGENSNRGDVKASNRVTPTENLGVDGPPSGLKPFPLGMALRACPQIADYGPGGHISSWREMMAAAVVVRSMLGVSPSAYQEACEVMGAENAATVVACILERGGHINSAGGYLRDLTRRAEKGEFGLGPMLMALVKANAGVNRSVG